MHLLKAQDVPAVMRLLSDERAVRLSRRAFLRSTGVAGSGLLLGIALGSQHRFAAAAATDVRVSAGGVRANRT